MRKIILLLVVVTLTFTACQSENKQEGIDSTLTSERINISETYCYSFTKNNDTAKLNFIKTNGVTTGELSYHLYQKDKNEGIIEGEMKGDTLILDYTFNSEGSQSVREVVFLKRNNQLIEGFGDVEEKDGKTVFKDKSKLIFGNSIVFEKVDCQ